VTKPFALASYTADVALLLLSLFSLWLFVSVARVALALSLSSSLVSSYLCLEAVLSAASACPHVLTFLVELPQYALRPRILV